MAGHAVGVAKGIRRLRHDHSLADFVLASESGKEWKVHKVVLLMHSDVLYRMSTSKDFIECQTGRAVVKDADDESIDAMVKYFYKLDIKEPSKAYDDEDAEGPESMKAYDDEADEPFQTVEGAKESISHYAGVWVLADMYNVQKLKKVVEEEFEKDMLGRLTQRWAYDCSFIYHAIEAMDQLEWVPSAFWKVAAMVLARELEKDHRCRVEEVQEMLGKHPEFATEMLKVIVEQNAAKPSRTLWD